jgi:hypothetical protein
MRIVSELLGVVIAGIVLNQITDGKLVCQLRRLAAWWDHESRIRMVIDAAAGAPETINEGERYTHGR